MLTPFWLRYYKMHSKPQKGKRKGEICEKKGEIPIPCIQVVRQMVTVSHDGTLKKNKSYTYADTTMLDDRFAIDFGAEKRQFLLKATSVEDAKMWVNLIQLAMKAYKLQFSTIPALPRASITGKQHKWWKADGKKHKPSIGQADQLSNPEQWEYWDQVCSLIFIEVLAAIFLFSLFGVFAHTGKSSVCSSRPRSANLRQLPNLRRGGRGRR
jgi:hypothetical protein